MNYIDLIIIFLFILFVWAEYRRGFLRLVSELFGLLLAFALAFKFFDQVGDWLSLLIKTPEFLMVSKATGFLLVWFLAQLIIFLLGRIISFYTPANIKENKWNIWLGFLPAAAKGLILVATTLVLIVVMPFDYKIKSDVNNAYIGGASIRAVLRVESKLEQIFNNSSQGSLTFLNGPTEDTKTTKLDFSTTEIRINPQAEEKILDLTNKERLKAGLAPLEQDDLVRNVARAHSSDMLIKGYFSHVSLDGENLVDRLLAGRAKFKEAAENIALAPTPEVAHIGLINSPKHKANILDPSFTKVGIGVIDAGKYGIMVTQNFYN